MAARILAIDDDDAILELYRFVFESEGFDIVTSPIACEKPQDVLAWQPDLIILDFFIGSQREGRRLFDQLRHDATTESIPIILCSAAEYELRDQVDEITTTDVAVIFKPFDVDDLLNTTRRLLAAHISRIA